MNLGVGVKLPSFDKARLGEENLEKVLKEAAAEAERQAKVHVLVDTGRLRASIQTLDEGPMRKGVKTGVQYGAFVEFGTGIAGSGSDPGPTPNEYRHGPKAGMVARPFLRPAMFNVRAKLKELFSKR